MDVRDPLNVGQAFRLGVSLGAQRLHLLGSTPSPPNAKLNRTARGAQHELPFVRGTVEDAFIGFRQNSLVVVALEYATASTDIRTVRQVCAERPVVLLVGNEAHGLPKSVLAEADHVAHLPMYGGVSSYNVAAALGIALWEWIR